MYFEKRVRSNLTRTEMCKAETKVGVNRGTKAQRDKIKSEACTAFVKSYLHAHSGLAAFPRGRTMLRLVQVSHEE